MKKLLTLLFIQQMALVPVIASDVTPKQEIKNSKGFASINYDRQDNDKEAKQRIINNHSAFNINIILCKKEKISNSKTVDQENKL